MTIIKLEIEAFLAAGVHFGHSTSRWHPRMAPYIHSKQAGRCIIDLAQTIAALEAALPVISDTIAQGKKVLFVGTKLQAQSIVKQVAQSVDMPFVTHRWMGGMLTNQRTINIQIKKLKELEKQMESGELAHKYSKLEVQKYQKQIDQLNHLYGGIKDLTSLPGLVYVTDMRTNVIAINEARKLNLPIVAIADSNVDPTLVSHPIPGNDDALKSLQLITGLVAQAISQAQGQSKGVKDNDQS